MRMGRMVALTMGALLLAGCASAPPPTHVVERDVVDANGVVVEREQYVVEDGPPVARVEVVPVAPYYGAVWVHGYYVRGYHHR